MKKIFKKLLVTSLILSTLTFVGCSNTQEGAKNEPIVVSSKDFTETNR